TDALDNPEDDHLAGAGGQSARRRRRGEDQQADDEQLLGTVEVTEPARGDQQYGVHQNVGVQDPQYLGDRCMQLGAHLGDRDIHDRRIEQDHEEAEAQREQHQPGAVLGHRARRRTLWSGHYANSLTVFGLSTCCSSVRQVNSPLSISATIWRTQLSSAREAFMPNSASIRLMRSRPRLLRVATACSYAASCASNATRRRSGNRWTVAGESAPHISRAAANTGNSSVGTRRRSRRLVTNSSRPASVMAYTVRSGRRPSRPVSSCSIRPCRCSRSTVWYSDPARTLITRS